MNSLQAGLIGVSVVVIAVLALLMWWQGARGDRKRKANAEAERSGKKPALEAVTAAASTDLRTDLRAVTRQEPSLGVNANATAVPTPKFSVVETLKTDANLATPNGAMSAERSHSASAPVAPPPAGFATTAQSSTASAPTIPTVLTKSQLDTAVPPSIAPSPVPPLVAQPPVASAPQAFASPVSTPSPSPASAAASLQTSSSPPSLLPLDERLHVHAVVTAYDGQAIDCQEFAEFAERSLAWGRVFRSSAWERIEQLNNGGAVQSLCLAVPLATRAGPLTDGQALEWKREVSRLCDRLNLDVVFGGDVGVTARAQELDQFLAAADVICVLYLIRKDGGQWSGTRLRGTLEANGFRLQSDGRFVYFEVESEYPIFSAVDGFERSFTPERLRTESVNALRLVFEASTVIHPVARFDVYRQTLRALARLLEAEIKDGSGTVVGEPEFVALRADVQAGSDALAQAGIECGGETATSLFR